LVACLYLIASPEPFRNDLRQHRLTESRHAC
jgi:hypothetical protein